MDEFCCDIKSWYVHPSGLNAYEVRNGFHSYGVNLEGMYCTCRLWELFGIPCVHAQATIIYTQQDPTRFINTWFGNDKFLATYNSNILPINDNNMWEPTPYTKPLPPVERRMPRRPCMKRKRHVSEHEDRGSTSVYEEGESFGKKEPEIETQFVTQTTPNVESKFVTQTAPTVDSEHVPETQEAVVEIDVEGDGLDMADLDQILHDLSYLRESKYSEAEILLCLNITQSQLKGFDALLRQSKKVANDVSFESEHVPETQEDDDENKGESGYEDGVKDDEDGVEDDEQGVDDEDGAEDDEEGVDDTKVRVRTQVRSSLSPNSNRPPMASTDKQRSAKVVSGVSTSAALNPIKTRQQVEILKPKLATPDAICFIGRRFSDDMVQADKSLYPFKITGERNDKPVILVTYKGEEKKFSAEEISSIVLA
ncbi:unnamed protein product [Lactuca virosa]|uniref:SWIM-type domain-containing protein n=1 Tax=Lactuca virosa TaxID=75947 RepID=A0AAU9P5L3_9ASTR|nr:unnamed protein product [Lactuca virosa]